MMGPGEVFQSETKYARGKMPRRGMDFDSRPEAFKTYPGAMRILLSEPARKGGLPVWDVVRARRSLRRFRGPAMPLADLSQLLWAIQGTTLVSHGFAFRAAPSAGALYPLETYLAVHAIEGIEPGIYHYDPKGQALELLRPGDAREAVAAAALDQDFTTEANVVLIWTAVFGRTTRKYGQRGYRYVYLDAGHIGHAAALAAVGLGYGSCPIGALYDDEVNALVGADGVKESVVYMTAVGRPS
jgi:SagB-type dehydrogenase family enzyme